MIESLIYLLLAIGNSLFDVYVYVLDENGDRKSVV